MSADRQATLKLLLRAIALSGGDFALLLARCNSIEVRDRLVADLKAQLGDSLYDRHITDADRVVNLVDILDEVEKIAICLNQAIAQFVHDFIGLWMAHKERERN